MTPPQVAVGQGLPSRVVGPLSQEDVLRFAGACGDFNPLHYDAETARRAGFRAPIVMGQLTAGIVAAWIADWCGVERLAGLDVRFVAPVMVGDSLTLAGSVTTVGSPDDDSVIELEVSASTGEVVVITARASVLTGPDGVSDAG